MLFRVQLPGTNHFVHSGRPVDKAVEAEYETRCEGLMNQVAENLPPSHPPMPTPATTDADVGSARAN